MLVRLARFGVRRRRTVLLGWLLVLAAMVAAMVVAGGESANDFSVPGTESQRAFDLLRERFPARAGDTVDVVFHADAGLADPAVRAEVEAAMRKIAEVDGVLEVESPYDDPTRISPQGTIGLAIAQLEGRAVELPDSFGDEIVDVGETADSGRITVELGGTAIQFATREPPGGTSERVGLAAAIVVLLVTFGSVVAMGLPIVVALFSLGIALASLVLIENVVDIVEFAPALAIMIGLGVGIDYALFIVTRFREGLHAGLEPEEAAAVALDTAGRAVIFAGLTVIISLAGLFLVGLVLVNGIAIAAMLAVAFAVITSVTLLPALLGFAGHAIDRLRIPGLHRDESGHRASVWFRWSRLLQRRPWPAIAAALALLVAAALPAFALRLGTQDAGTDPTSQTTRRAYDLLAEGFGPGFNGPFLVAAEMTPGSGTAVLDELAARLSQVDGVAAVTPPNLNEAGDTGVVTVFPQTAPQDKETEELLHHLRDTVVPQVVEGTGAEVSIGGITAVFVDLADVLGRRLPWFIGAVLVFSFLLLMAVFRSLVVPLKAAVMNLLSIGAAYGVLVMVFQWGWGKDLIGLDKTIPIPSFAPMMLFAVLFGLSMDYEVFLLSRIREEWIRTNDSSLAVADGLAATARVITAAAAIMVTVFASFVLNDDPILKLFGMGLATAIFVDATVVRTVLVPATMEVLGRANWWFPKWLDRVVPKLSVEVSDTSRHVLEDSVAPFEATEPASRDGERPSRTPAGPEA